MKRMVYFLFAFFLIQFSICGCKTSRNPEPGSEILKFIFISTVAGEDFFIPVKKGMVDAAKMMDVHCEFTGTEGVDIPEQVRLVEEAIQKGYDGIALNIIDNEAFDNVILQALKKGIPVISFNSDDRTTANARLSSVCQNLYEAGKIMGREASKYILDSSEILVTMHDEGISALEERLNGALDGLKEAGKGAIRHRVVITGYNSVEAAEIIEKEIKSQPQIDFIICTGQADTEGAGMAIDRLGKARNCRAAGFDISPGILEYVEKGFIVYTIDQQPYIQGFYPVVQLALLKRYGIMPSNIDAGASLITQQNADKVKELSLQQYR